ncbi:MAG: NAD(P)/FAD-dependent oxidoreductase [Candidatus Latescibacteria bacterium]|nr:NAD(P)/FAD-dependent oxidoreductase [Candidatus Latescibacterota bacterium]
MSCHTLIIGGGAAGLMAAIAAADRGDRVTLLEKNERLGRKVLISGNGRCNVMNLDPDLVHFHGGNPNFARHALSAFPVEETLRFFHDLGIETRVENRGRVFPASNQAASVVDLLEDRALHAGVRIVTGADVADLRRDGGFRVRAADGRAFEADRVVLTTGGTTAPSLGGSDDGIRMACRFGHRCTPTFPGLAPLETERSALHKLQGVRVTVAAEALVDGRAVKSDVWELLFRFYGLSGPVVLNLSEAVAPLIRERLVAVRINFFPGLHANALDDFLRERWQRHPHRSVGFSFTGVLPDKVPPVLLPLLGVSPDQRAGDVSAKTRRRIAEGLTAWEVRILDIRPFAEAEVMVGGIVTDDVDPRTLESKLVPGLFFAGEMLDVHGDLGGFNFQWAWSSGWVAGGGG